MMNTVDITGKWTGYYTYGEGYGAGVKGTSEAFAMELVETANGITGLCADVYTEEHFGQPANISGFIENNMISFIKTYPCMFSVDEQGGVAIDRLGAPYEIHYTGELSGNRFNGEWEFCVGQVTDEHGYLEHLCTGTWTMQRV